MHERSKTPSGDILSVIVIIPLRSKYRDASYHEKLEQVSASQLHTLLSDYRGIVKIDNYTSKRNVIKASKRMSV